MIQVTPKHKIYLGIQSIDFRKGIDGLAALCQRQLGADPKSGHVFIFRNKKASAIKLLLYDGQGFWLCQKRLSSGRFTHWPTSEHSVVSLSVAQLQALLYNANPALVQTSQPWQAIN